MLHVALWEPEIPPNTGNVSRLCVGVGARLHLIGKLGFRIDDSSVRRAGLDHWPHLDLHLHPDWESFFAALPQGTALWFVDNPAPRSYTKAEFTDNSAFIFGKETKGLPDTIRATHHDRLIDIPMPNGLVRSLNLSNSVAVVVYEALRQIHGW